MKLSQVDVAVLGQLRFDEGCEPSYDLIRACLVWPDERPHKISNEGYELLGDLWIVRGYLHRWIPPENWGLAPSYFQGVWRLALESVPGWPGFRRLELSEVDRAYLEQSLSGGSSDAF